MPDFRSFATVSDPDPREIILSPDESSHLVRVNRARRGDPVTVFDGKGSEWICRLMEEDRKSARLAVEQHRRTPPPACRVTLAQALPKGKTLDLIVRKATEIGVMEIAPLVTEHTEVRLDEARGEAKHGKWENAAVEAAKQSGNSYLPEISPIQSIEDFLSHSGAYELKLIASLRPQARLLRSAFTLFLDRHGRPPASAVWLIGPEGDFSARETELAEAAGFAPITLGPTVLRCETAALYALSILSYELQNLQP
jgi:16S rRNA (uracil1498-N3)-methyltransferase